MAWAGCGRERRLSFFIPHGSGGSRDDGFLRLFVSRSLLVCCPRNGELMLAIDISAGGGKWEVESQSWARHDGLCSSEQEAETEMPQLE
jgi:hypothetical protein